MLPFMGIGGFFAKRQENSPHKIVTINQPLKVDKLKRA